MSRELQISAYDRGLHYGDGLFETIVCLRGRPRFLREHLERLAQGCARLGIALRTPASLGAQVMGAAAHGEDCIVKLIVTRGATAERGYRVPRALDPTVLVLRYPYRAPEASLIETGMRVRLGSLRLSESERLAGMKHLNRLEQVLAREEWSDPAIGESLLASRSGELISGTMSNVFIVRNDILETPLLALCGVRGIMRGMVLRRARTAGIETRERAMPWSENERIGECFLTSSVLGICPVRELDGRPLAVGALTRRLQALMAPLLTNEGGEDG